MREIVDFNHVPTHQIEIDARLCNWARWVRVRPHGWQTHPMWRMYQSKARQWEADPHIPTALDTLDALLIERTVSKMPEKHRDAVRWHYVLRADPLGMARKLGVSREGLFGLVCDGRVMVGNLAC